MSLSALLNNDDPVEDTKLYLESLNREMDRLIKRDQLELMYQDWKFANYQEFELISEWNTQCKELVGDGNDLQNNDLMTEEVHLDDLYDNIQRIRNEWKDYESYKETRSQLLSKNIQAKPIKHRRRRRTKLEMEAAANLAALSQMGTTDVKTPEIINDHGNRSKASRSDTTNKTDNTMAGINSPTSDVDSGHKDELDQSKLIKKQEASSSTNSAASVTASVANGIVEDQKDEAERTIEANRIGSNMQNSDQDTMDDLKKTNDPSSDIDSDANTSANDGSDENLSNKLDSDDLHSEPADNEEEPVSSDAEKDQAENINQTDESEEEIIVKEYDDNNDEDFAPEIKKPKPNGKIVTINSDRPKIVRELIKLRNKGKAPKSSKRRYTAVNITEYSPTEKKISVKITLKQMHVKKLKKILQDARKAEEKRLQEEAKQIADQESPRKRRKIDRSENTKQEDEDDKEDDDLDGLPTYGMKMSLKDAKAIQRHYDNTYTMIWKDMARKDCMKISRLVQQIQSTRALNYKKTSSLCAREARKWQTRNFKQVKDFQTRARKGIREMANFWKKNEREERDLKKKAEREALELAKKEEEEKESKRQAKKLNFLLTQTELYSHFIGRKIKTSALEGNEVAEEDEDNYDLTTTAPNKNDFHAIDFDNENDEQLKLKAAQNASNALAETRAKAKAFDDAHRQQQSTESDDEEEMNFQNPTSLGEITIEQPKMLACTLKEYQLKGLNWLANLYDQGINGILADEMGLGKTVQSISVLAHLAEHHNIWGPFLVVTPASTLHNWVNEISKFVPQFKILPYWGSANDRKVLRKFWDRKNLRYSEKSPFHVMITSYQMVVADASYLQKMKWQYMILDEAQAIKSSQSSRWKNLLSFHCRNRLLLTGTPIQNNMQELWALLHFIMPSLFDSHDEFNEWFSRDIESHAEGNSSLNQQQLRRLHMILKPFMLRRIKKNVQSELGDKIEIDVMCDLTQRQTKLYQVLKSQMSSNYDAIENAAAEGSDIAGGGNSDQSIINAVMQFRKVCNHPDLFERADINSPFSFTSFGKTSSLISSSIATSGGLTETISELMYSSTNPINCAIPKLIYEDLILPNYNNSIDIMEKLLLSDFSIYDPVNNKEMCQYLGLLTGLAYGSFRKIHKSNYFERIINLKKESKQSSQNLITVVSNANDLIADFIAQADTNLPNLTGIRNDIYHNDYLNSIQPGYCPKVVAPPINFNVNGSLNFTNKMSSYLFNPVITTALSSIPPPTQYNMFVKKCIPIEEFPISEMYPDPLNKHFSSNISMPSMDRFITESAKLKKLDELLVELKKNDHRVLIYFQMTKMMDLMEEYLTYRQYNHIRLDGSSKLEDRRDLVHDWQTNPEIFIFLLSTRAGGLGINLTAADTVIFYDSDWNPTIDSQAMDRAHRLGQTKQVTVYRLLVRGTIEERMRDRAKQKEQVQQVVMEGKTKDTNIQTTHTRPEHEQLTPKSLSSEPEATNNLITVKN